MSLAKQNAPGATGNRPERKGDSGGRTAYPAERRTAAAAMRAMDAPSVLGGWARTVVSALDARGLNGRELAARAGIDVQTMRLNDPMVRCPISATTRMWRLAVEATGDPCFGLTVSRFVNYPTFHALGAAVLASSTLGDALRRVVRYSRIISDAATLRLVDRDDGSEFILDVADGVETADEALDAFLSLVVRAARTLRDDRLFGPRRVDLVRPIPTPSEPFRRFFRVPVRFSAPANVLEFAREDLETPVPAGNAELARRFDEVLLRYSSQFDDALLVSRVRACITERLPDGDPSQQRVAQALGMGARTLQRRLADEGTSFQAILNDTRAELARAYLKDGWTVTEVAFALGFQDMSSFSRAFRRWTGSAPRAMQRS